jgi:DNA-binding XRE family transcriptional regulator
LTTTSTNREELGAYISQAEAARIIGTSKQAIAYRVRKGYFTTKVVAGLVLVLRAEAESIAPKHKSRPRTKESEKEKLPTKSVERAHKDDSGEYISQAEAARIRGVSEQAIADLIHRGRLTTVSAANRTLVLRAEIEAFVPRPRTGRPPTKKKPNTKATKQKKSKK